MGALESRLYAVLERSREDAVEFDGERRALLRRVAELENAERVREEDREKTVSEEVSALRAALEEARDDASNARTAQKNAEASAEMARNACEEAQLRVKSLEDAQASLKEQLESATAESAELLSKLASARHAASEAAEDRAKVEVELRDKILEMQRAASEASEQHAKTEMALRDTVNELQREIEDADIEYSKLKLVSAKHGTSLSSPRSLGVRSPALSVRSAPSFTSSLGQDVTKYGNTLLDTSADRIRQLQSIEMEEVERHDAYAEKMNRMGNRVERLELQLQAANHVADRLKVVAVEYEQKWQESVDGEARLAGNITRLEREAAMVRDANRTNALSRILVAANIRRCLLCKRECFAKWKCQAARIASLHRRGALAVCRILHSTALSRASVLNSSERLRVALLRWRLAVISLRNIEEKHEMRLRALHLIAISRARTVTSLAFEKLRCHARAMYVRKQCDKVRARALQSLFKRQQSASFLRNSLLAWKMFARSSKLSRTMLTTRVFSRWAHLARERALQARSGTAVLLLLRCILRVRRDSMMRQALLRWRQSASAFSISHTASKNMTEAVSTMRCAGARRFLRIIINRRRSKLARAINMLKSNVERGHNLSRVCYTIGKILKRSSHTTLMRSFAVWRVHAVRLSDGEKYRASFREVLHTKQDLEKALDESETQHEMNMMQLIGAAHKQRCEQGVLALSRMLKTWMGMWKRKAFHTWVSACSADKYRQRAIRCVVRIVDAQESRRDSEKLQRAWMLLRANVAYRGYLESRRVSRYKSMKCVLRAGLTRKIRCAWQRWAKHVQDSKVVGASLKRFAGIWSRFRLTQQRCAFSFWKLHAVHARGGIVRAAMVQHFKSRKHVGAYFRAWSRRTSLSKHAAEVEALRAHIDTLEARENNLGLTFSSELKTSCYIREQSP